MLEDKVNLIKTTLISQLSDLSGEIKVMGLSDPVSRPNGTTKVPMVISSDGSEEYSFVDNNYSVMLYQHLLSKTYVEDLGRTYGNSPQRRGISKVRLVALIKRGSISPLDLEAKIYSSIPNGIVVLESNFDATTVFESEFTYVEYTLPKNTSLLSVLYTIEYFIKNQ